MLFGAVRGLLIAAIVLFAPATGGAGGVPFASDTVQILAGDHGGPAHVHDGAGHGGEATDHTSAHVGDHSHDMPDLAAILPVPGQRLTAAAPLTRIAAPKRGSRIRLDRPPRSVKTV